ncbi:Serine/threonine protein kinase [Nannocystis exedens]|uniref:Serine/threonine protein kinase n=1 Tax=Nannocystis exedens TaxID=54 RepID=A0A1I2HUP5_9BACT|nr:serine/threonine-protein kinase [Nannocystis exedens]PCC72031.1 Serine/threonine-protein kinase PrkC [Nannocystis exedens]SFF33895.1 Serine/threonine protein kinase [Nannocystis exedens]
MDNKRNGSGPPPPPRNGGHQPPPPGRPATFQFTDDDDEPLAPPQESGESFPELAADLVDEAAPEEGESLDSGLNQDAPRPPPSPLRERRGAFLDDGEIALPPGLSQVVRSQASRFPFRAVVDDDDAELGAALTPADDEPAPPWADDDDDAPTTAMPVQASASTSWPKAHGPKASSVADDDDLDEPTRRHAVDDMVTVQRRAAREEDDFGDLNEPSRAFPAAKPKPAPQVELDAPTIKRRVDSTAVGAAIDRSGLAPVLEVTLHPVDDGPLPPPPMAALADNDLPPLIATGSAQSGVGFARAEVAAALAEEPAPPPEEAEVDQPLSALAVSQDRPRTGVLTPIRVSDIDDDDDELGDPGDSMMTAPVKLAPPPSEPLGEPFPLDLWSDPDELIGRDIDRWRLVKPLTRGITTRVYAAVDEQSGRHVAIRVLGPDHSPASRRGRQFLYEAQQLIKLRHESLVEVIDAGITADHLTYYVMEQVDGDPLGAVLRAEGPLPWQQVAILVTQICEALIVAADRGVIATDLNLGSVLRLHAGDDEARRRQPIKLLGVGIAPVASIYRSLDGNLVESKGTPPGQAEYMAPELASGGFPGESTSVYALGVMMYELLTGRTPFRGDSFLSIIKKQMYDEPNSPRLVVPQQEIAEPFEEVVLRALAKDPSKRYGSIRELHEAVLAARAREGELRRATAILALDPTFWDEEAARNAEPPEARAVAAQSEPQPLATFTADLRQRNPALASAVLDAPPPPASRPVRSTPVPQPRISAPSEPRAIPIPPEVRNAAPPAVTPSSSSRPEPSMILAHLAPPIRAPEPVLPRPKTAPLPVIVVAPPTAAVPATNFVRNVSIAVILGAALLFLVILVSRRQNPAPARKDDPVAAEAPRRAKEAPRPKKPTRETRKQVEDEPEPIVVGASQPVPEAIPPQPVPEAIPQPPPQPVPEAIPQPPQPTQSTAVSPEPAPAKVEPVPEPPPAKVEPPPPAKVEPPPPAKAEPKAKPKPKAPDSDLPLRIEPIRLKSYFTAMEPRVVKACSSSPGAAGARVSVKITVDVRGNVKAVAQDRFKGTPLGNCVENFVETSRFNESQQGGSRLHVFAF